jgi:hypothetical protein
VITMERFKGGIFVNTAAADTSTVSTVRMDNEGYARRGGKIPSRSPVTAERSTTTGASSRPMMFLLTK